MLCTDKTGTLTMDEVTLVQYIGMDGNPCLQLLRLAFANSFHQTGLKNLLVGDAQCGMFTAATAARSHQTSAAAASAVALLNAATCPLSRLPA